MEKTSKNMTKLDTKQILVTKQIEEAIYNQIITR
jgi:hypothetical protein